MHYWNFRSSEKWQFWSSEIRSNNPLSRNMKTVSFDEFWKTVNDVMKAQWSNVIKFYRISLRQMKFPRMKYQIICSKIISCKRKKKNVGEMVYFSYFGSLLISLEFRYFKKPTFKIICNSFKNIIEAESILEI